MTSPSTIPAICTGNRAVCPVAHQKSALLTTQWYDIMAPSIRYFTVPVGLYGTIWYTVRNTINPLIIPNPILAPCLQQQHNWNWTCVLLSMANNCSHYDSWFAVLLLALNVPCRWTHTLSTCLSCDNACLFRHDEHASDYSCSMSCECDKTKGMDISQVKFLLILCKPTAIGLINLGLGGVIQDWCQSFAMQYACIAFW